MKKAIPTCILPLLLLVPTVLLLSSCVPQKKIKYLQEVQKMDTAASKSVRHGADYRIQPRDNLYIRVYALDEKAYLFFNKLSSGSSYNDLANDASIYLNSYSVFDDGTIDFPILGKVTVKDKTVYEVIMILQQMIGEFLKETTVVVKMVNFRVTLVGEVAKPGEFSIYKDDINIFEAISLAGDLTEFANRSRVALIRLNGGRSKVHYLDLTSNEILVSEFYHLQPNDIVYVAPLGYKRWGLGSTFPWAIVLASISTTLLLINYFQK
jgi:polysaccharide biosynthesis/export protein